PPIIHRDIKPQNIIITPNGRAMLVDFGISKIYDPTLATTIGAKAVTPGYSPPEQYGSGATDARADIYALGATLYTLLSGQEPPESVDLLLGSQTMPPPRQLNVQISADLEQVILKAMDTKTSRRFQNVTDLKTALLQPDKGKGAARWPQWAWGALALLVVAVVSGLLWANRGDDAVTETAIVQIAVTETAVPPSATTETTIVPVITTATPPSPTPTTAATATIRSTATPRMAGPTMSAGFRVRISSQYSSVYVRRGPGTAYATLTTLRAGEEVVVLAKNRDDTWYNVELADGQRGWISVSVTERVDTFTMADIAVAATIPATPTATITPTRTPTRPLPTATPAPSQPEPPDTPPPSTVPPPPTVPPPSPYPPYP
ncbi:MAG: SH3 domain-containing protein, partial [Anaerolinea sp.]|nr:SH3 domain-containing protein [Anaerolinea sp.]